MKKPRTESEMFLASPRDVSRGGREGRPWEGKTEPLPSKKETELGLVKKRRSKMKKPRRRTMVLNSRLRRTIKKINDSASSSVETRLHLRRERKDSTWARRQK